MKYKKRFKDADVLSQFTMATFSRDAQDFEDLESHDAMPVWQKYASNYIGMSSCIPGKKCLSRWRLIWIICILMGC